MTRYVAPATKVFTRWHLHQPGTEPDPGGPQRFATTRTGNGYPVAHPDATDGTTRCGIPMLTTDLWTTGTPTADDPICSACADNTTHTDPALFD